MLHSLLGAALWRSLERLIAPPPKGGPDPHIEITPPQEVAPRVAPVGVSSASVYPTVERLAMGSLFQVFLCGEDREFLESVGEEALDEVLRLQRQLSHFDPHSDISRINEHARSGWVRLEPSLFSLVQQCVEYCQATGGAFDITAAGLAARWGFGPAGPAGPPDVDDLGQYQRAMGPNAIELDADEQQVRFANSETCISLAAIGKGYAIDRAMATLQVYGIASAVIHGGQSSIGVLGSGPNGTGWEFAIRDPEDTGRVLHFINAVDQSVSTSGVSQQFVEFGGTRYGHIMDPRSGRPVTGRYSVTVVAPTGAEAEALSTACFVLGPDQSAPLLGRLPNVSAVFLEGMPGSIEVVAVGPGAA